MNESVGREALAAVDRAVFPAHAAQPGQRPVMPPRPVIKTTDQLLAERGKTHGDFTDHARVTQAIKDVMQASPNWGKLTAVQKEALEMNAHKVGRILSGNPDHHDHWDDISGYATLVSQRLPTT